MDVHPREAWTDVAEHIAARPDGADAAGDDSPFIGLQDRAFIRDVLPQMPVDGRSVLEVGCGPGGKLDHLLRHNRPARLVGADITPKMVELSSARFAGTEVEVVQLPIDGAYPFADEEFDTVFTCTVLHHNPPGNVPKVVAEIARVCRDQVWIFEAVSDRRSSSSGNFHIRHPSYYEGLFAAHGFRLAEQHPVRVALSNRVADAAQRLAHTRHLRQPPYQEGAPVARARLLIERTLLPVTSRLDPWVPPTSGLRGLRFDRG